ncbi:MAG: NUDIX hydrolase [Bacteroidaceae bacterium]|nr:NUDIX hydrolase [Bacteroidaceae bacterium]
MKETHLRDMSWKILSSEYLIRRPWLTARRDRAQLPDGRIHEEYYVLEYPSWINVIAITTEGDMVMVRQYRHGIGRTCIELVAGVVEKDEEPLHAAQRELLEETGFGGGQWRQLLKLAPNAGAMNNYAYCFLATGVSRLADTQHLDANEDVEVHVLPQEEVRQMLDSGEIFQAQMVAPLLKYFYADQQQASSKGPSALT